MLLIFLEPLLLTASPKKIFKKINNSMTSTARPTAVAKKKLDFAENIPPEVQHVQPSPQQVLSPFPEPFPAPGLNEMNDYHMRNPLMRPPPQPYGMPPYMAPYYLNPYMPPHMPPHMQHVMHNPGAPPPGYMNK